MSGHRWFSISSLLILTVLTGCQTGESRMSAWNPFRKDADKAATPKDDSSFALPKFASRKVDNERSDSSDSTTPVAEEQVERLLTQGQQALQDDRLDDAKLAYTEVLQSSPDNATAHHGMAMAADLSQLWADAEYHYRQALRIRPRDANLLCDIGYSYLLQNRYSEASRYLNHAVEINPQHESAQMNLALLDLRQGNRAAASNRITARFGVSAEAAQVLTQLESQAQAGVQTASFKTETTNVIPPNATFEQVQELARLERVEAEKRRATQGIPQRQGPIGAGNVTSVSPRPPIAGNSLQPLMNQEQPNSNARSTSHPNLAQGSYPATAAQPNVASVSTGVPNQQSASVANSTLQTSKPSGLSAPLPSSYGAMPDRVVPVYSSGAFQPPASGSLSYGQPLGFSPPPQQPFSTVSDSRSTEIPQNANFPGSSAAGANSNSYAPNAYASGSAPGNNMAPQTRSSQPLYLEGLNAGPGAMFPIGSPMFPVGSPGSPLPISSNGNTVPNGNSMPGNPATGIPGNANLNMNNISSPGSNSMINGAFYEQTHSALPSQEWANQQQQQLRAQQLQSQQWQKRDGQTLPAPANSNASFGTGSSTSASRPAPVNPLTAYELQRQQLDSEYNKTLQQLDRQNTSGSPQFP